jgi:hypothetical protein
VISEKKDRTVGLHLHQLVAVVASFARVVLHGDDNKIEIAFVIKTLGDNAIVAGPDFGKLCQQFLHNATQLWRELKELNFRGVPR